MSSANSGDATAMFAMSQLSSPVETTGTKMISVKTNDAGVKSLSNSNNNKHEQNLPHAFSLTSPKSVVHALVTKKTHK